MLLATILRYSRSPWRLHRIVIKFPEIGKVFLILNDPRYSKLIAAVLSQCQLFLLIALQ